MRSVLGKSSLPASNEAAPPPTGAFMIEPSNEPLGQLATYTLVTSTTMSITVNAGSEAIVTVRPLPAHGPHGGHLSPPLLALLPLPPLLLPPLLLAPLLLAPLLLPDSAFDD